MKKVNIYDKQNEEEMLKIQFAAKYYYSLAATLSLHAFFLTLISEILNIVAGDNIYLLIIYIIVCVLVELFIMMSGKYRIKAAKIRNIFDDKLFDFNKHEYSQEIKRYVKKTCINHKKQAQLLMNNTGKDNPPGVKDWYCRRKACNKNEMIFLCQQENLMFDKEMYKYFVIMSIILIGLYAVSLIISYMYIGFSISMIVSIIPITHYISNKCKGFIKIRDLHMKLEGTMEVTKNNIETCNLITIQDNIEKRRTLDIDIPNIIHRIKSKKIHEETED